MRPSEERGSAETSRSNVRKFLPLLFCLVLVPHILHAADKTEADGKREAAKCEGFFDRGQQYLYDNAYDEANREFTLFIKCAPNDPRGDLRRVLNLFFQKRREQKKNELKMDGVMYAQYMTFIDEGIVKTEIKISSKEDVAFHTYVKAYLVSLRGVLEFANGKEWAALDSAKELKELCNKSTYQDSKFLIGLLGYMIDRRGFFARRGASFFGLPNNKREGFRLIREAAEGNDGPYVDDIWFLMLQILTDKEASEKDRIIAQEVFGYSANDIYERLGWKYPQNEQIVRFK
jgi:hypothetical protein